MHQNLCVTPEILQGYIMTKIYIYGAVFLYFRTRKKEIVYRVINDIPPTF